MTQETLNTKCDVFLALTKCKIKSTFYNLSAQDKNRDIEVC